MVSSPAKFKSSDQAPALETRVIAAGDYDLVETVYDWDAAPGVVDTKAQGIITTDNISAFTIDAWADEISEGDNHFIDNAGVSKSTSWSITGNPTWVNNTDIQFWSWANAHPSITSKNQTTLTGLTASITGTDADEDIIFAYNKEHRKVKEDGTSGDVTSDYNLDIHFNHALCQVGFTAAGLPAGYKITKIEMKNVNTTSTFSVESNGSSTQAGGNRLTFNHTPANPTDITFYNNDSGLGKTGSTDFFLMIPQTVGGKGVDIVWTIKPDLQSGDIGGSELTITRTAHVDIDWEAGKQYIYQLGLTEKIITFIHIETKNGNNNTNRNQTGQSGDGTRGDNQYGFNVIYNNSTANKIFNNDTSLMDGKYSWSASDGTKGNVTASMYNSANNSTRNSYRTVDAGRSGNTSTSVGWSNDSPNMVNARLNSLAAANDIKNITKVEVAVGTELTAGEILSACTTSLIINGNEYTSSSPLHGTTTFWMNKSENSIKYGTSWLIIRMNGKPFNGNKYYDYDSVKIYYLGNSGLEGESNK